ncbi:TRIM2_3 [Mytilus edulis]|uniref:TRIM2_3 n=1 Tax=Mytilus edulis TaxID=6550 RepID=A0A8S3QSC6_MYTED|nr:TRIM2_3 [Mytilus edulis]
MKGLILVTDRDSNAVHILSIGGEFVTSMNESHGIEKPFCLNIDHNGQLLIGCESEGTKDGVAKCIYNLGASETIRDLDLKDIQCTTHNNEQCIIYCQDCEVLSCAVCLLKSHQNHKLAKIDDVYSQKVKKLQELDNKISQKLPHFVKCEKDLKEIKSGEQTQHKGVKQIILKRKCDLKEEITKHTGSLIKELDRQRVSRITTISKQLRDIKQKSADLSFKKAKIQEAFQSNKASTIFTTSDEVSKYLPAIPGNILSKRQVLLSQTKDKKYSLDSLVTIPSLKVTGIFTSDLPSIYRIKNLINGVNIMCPIDDNIQTFTLKDNKCLVTNIAEDVGGDIIDMTVTNQNKLLFTIASNSEIKCLETFTPGCEVKVLISMSPLDARGIHASVNTILIGFVDAEELFPITEASRRGIMIYDYNCRHVRTIERDQNNQLIFSSPDTITTNINGDICVVDSTNNDNWEGRVVVLGEWGNFKWAYNGHPSINTESKFTPYDLVTTSKGLILVTDRDSDAIHILSLQGDLVSSLKESYGIERPLCLNIDRKGQLLIGCGSEGTKDEVAKLHVVDMSF